MDLETFFSTAKGAAEKLLSVTHSTEINLEKIYAHVSGCCGVRAIINLQIVQYVSAKKNSCN